LVLLAACCASFVVESRLPPAFDDKNGMHTGKCKVDS
jgi:hypothetical protein